MKKVFAIVSVLPLLGIGACMSHEVERYPVAEREVVYDHDFDVDDFDDDEVEIDIEHEYDD